MEPMLSSHSVMSDSETPLTAICQAFQSFTTSQCLLSLMSIESYHTTMSMPYNHCILCCPLLLLSSVFPSIRVFANQSAFHIRWPKCWTFSFSMSLSNEYSGLISFRIDWFDLLAVQGTFKGLCQHSSKASILQHSPGCGPTPSWMWFNSHICTFLLEKP